MTDGCLPSHVSAKFDLLSKFWEQQPDVLRRPVKRWVYSAHISSWLGEEEEVIADIIQEAICRTLERMRKAERQEADTVNSPDFLSRTIARNLFIDLVRKDKRIVPLSQLTHSSGEESFEFELVDNAEDVNEQVFREAVFNAVVPEIAKFPKKQKFALLVDIANRTNFISEEALLRKSFLKEDIRLEDYLDWQPMNIVERSRFASLLSISYKRVAHLNCMKPYHS